MSGQLAQRRSELLARATDIKAELSQCARVYTADRLDKVRSLFTETGQKLTSTTAIATERDQQLTKLRKRLEVWGQTLMQGGVCPTCQQPVTLEHRTACLAPIAQEIVALEGELNAAKATEGDLTTQTAQLKQELEGAQYLADRVTELEQIQDDLAQVGFDEQTIEAVATSHVENVLTEQRQVLIHTAATIRAERNPYESERAATQGRLAEAQQYVTSEGIKAQRMRRETAVYEYWQQGFSKQGIQSLLMDEVAAVFNAARGTIFPVLTQGVYDVQFSTTSQTKAGEWRERTEFQILERGRAIPYAALSGGQRRRIDIGVMLVLVKAVSEWMRVPGILGMLVLDEVFGFLDASGAEGLMEALREVQATIPCIYAVSHDPQLQALFSNVLVVAQDVDGISRIIEGAE